MPSGNPQLSFLSKIYTILTSADSASADTVASSPIYIAFCSPGIPWTTSQYSLDTTTDEGQSNMKQWSYLVNTIPSATKFSATDPSQQPIVSSVDPGSGTWTTTGNQLYNIYNDFLEGAKADQPSLSATDQKRLADARTDLMQKVVDPNSSDTNPQPTGLVSLYKRYKTAWFSAWTAYINGQQPNSNTNPAVLAQLKNDVDSCLQDWQTYGYKGQVENDQATIAEFTGADFANQISAAARDFTDSQLQTKQGVVYPTPPIPVSFFTDTANDASWSTYSYSHSDVETYSNTSTANFGGSSGDLFAAFDTLGFTLGAGADMSSNKQTVQSDDNEWTVSFDLVQLPLERDWFRYDLLTASSWSWQAGSAGSGTAISRGHVPMNSDEKATMPVYPTAVLLVRNVKITAKLSHLLNTVNSFNQSENIRVGWGPFNLGSVNSSTSDTTTSNQSSLDSNGLVCTGVTIIGFICEVVNQAVPSQ